MASYSREQALADGLLIEYDDHVKRGEQAGNCPSCFKVGPYPHTCVECNRTITLFINAEYDIVNPRLLARLKQPPMAAITATTCAPPGLTYPLRPPIEVNGWTLDEGIWHPWVKAWLRDHPAGHFALIAIYTADWESLATFGDVRRDIVGWLRP